MPTTTAEPSAVTIRRPITGGSPPKTLLQTVSDTITSSVAMTPASRLNPRPQIGRTVQEIEDARRHVSRRPVVNGDADESHARRSARLDLLEETARSPGLHQRQFGIAETLFDQTPCITEGCRPQQNRVDDAERRGADSDPGADRHAEASADPRRDITRLSAERNSQATMMRSRRSRGDEEVRYAACSDQVSRTSQTPARMRPDRHAAARSPRQGRRSSTRHGLAAAFAPAAVRPAATACPSRAAAEQGRKPALHPDDSGDG